MECHPFFNQSKLLEFCKERDVAVAAFSPLGSPARPWAGEETENLLEDPKLKEIAEQHGKLTNTLAIAKPARGLLL